MVTYILKYFIFMDHRLSIKYFFGAKHVRINNEYLNGFICNKNTEIIIYNIYMHIYVSTIYKICTKNTPICRKKM
jgi:hypothetical protein